MEALPSLSRDGFIVNKQILMLKLYEHFTVADYIQSNTFAGKVVSLRYILNESKDQYSMISMVTDHLTRLYEAYFTTVAVDTVLVPSDSKLELTVNITCTDAQGKIYRLKKLVEQIQSKITAIGTDEVKYHE